MGHGASSPKSSTNPLFVSHELAQASTILAEDEKFRELFINFIKSGLWIERLAQLVPEDTFVQESQDASLFSESNFSFRHYQSSKTMSEMHLSAKEWSSSKRTTSSASAYSPKNSSKTVAPPSEYFSESYVNIEDFRCFNSSQLISILTHVLYPLFITHSDSDGSSLSGMESTCTELRDAMGLRRPKRVQEVFLGIAAYFSESELYLELQDPSWVQLLPHTFDAYPLCITISDTSLAGCPIIYANKAFLTLTNFAPGQLQDSNLDILNGPNTEDTQIELLNEAIENKRAAKIAITHYTAGGKKEFPNFIALKPSGKYVIAVHFVPSRLTHVEDIKLVDDVLMVLAYVVKHPYQTQPAIRLDLPLPRGLSAKTENYLKDLRNPVSPGRPPRSPRGHTPTRLFAEEEGREESEERVGERGESGNGDRGLHNGRVFNLAPLDMSELSRENSGSSVPGIA